MEQITVRNLTFSYRGAEEAALSDISFDIHKGDFVLLIGESGCGKTTLLRHLKRDTAPVGTCRGKILFDGRPLQEMSAAEHAARIGIVQQNPESAAATDKVWHELAFGLESLSCPQRVMQAKVAEMTAFFGLESIFYSSMDSLSGGQRQMVNLASVMVMEPELLILDEPTSQLDPIAAGDFFHILRRINEELGTTILMTEHRMEEAFSLCDRVLVLDRGRLLLEDTPSEAVRKLYAMGHSMYFAMPAAARLYMELNRNRDGEKTAGRDTKCVAENAEALDMDIPLNVKQGNVWFSDFYYANSECIKEGNTRLSETEGEKKAGMYKAGDGGNADDRKKQEKKEAALQARELWFRYEREGADILKACSISLRRGSITALLGGNGAGKSTLLHVLAGHFLPYDGRVEHHLRVGMLPQNPQVMFAKKTVEEELRDSIKTDKGTSRADGAETIEKTAHCFGLKSLLDHHPYDLSGGEMQKLALAKLVLGDYDLLLLDEPGKGMDYAFKEEMGRMLRNLAAEGKTILLVSHDVEFSARYADYCGLFFDGHTVSIQGKREFFGQNNFYTTAVRRICRNYLQDAVVFEDVVKAFGRGLQDAAHGGEEQSAHDEGSRENRTLRDRGFSLNGCPEKNEVGDAERIVSPRKHIWLALVIFMLVMPATIYVGETFLHQRKYYFISMLLVLEAIASFFLRFEYRKPKVREIMVVAVLCAITAAARMAFYMVPGVKPMAALVILSGVSLGGEIGFLVGAFSMLISNIFYTQGPWTPWQMFAMGIVGFAAGMLFRQDSLLTKGKRIGICVFGFFAVVILYGGVMNPASVIVYQDNITVEMLIAACAAGLPFDVLHGAATSVFLALGAGPMLDKLSRVKKKYGF